MTLPAVTCTHCGRHFSRKSSLKQHVRDAHMKPHNKPSRITNKQIQFNFIQEKVRDRSSR